MFHEHRDTPQPHSTQDPSTGGQALSARRASRGNGRWWGKKKWSRAQRGDGEAPLKNKPPENNNLKYIYIIIKPKTKLLELGHPRPAEGTGAARLRAEEAAHRDARAVLERVVRLAVPGAGPPRGGRCGQGGRGRRPARSPVPATGSLGGELAAFRARPAGSRRRAGRSRKVYGITARGEALFAELLAAESRPATTTGAVQPEAGVRPLPPARGPPGPARAPARPAGRAPGPRPGRRRPAANGSTPTPARSWSTAPRRPSATSPGSTA